jgi:hypothetical protein
VSSLYADHLKQSAHLQVSLVKVLHNGTGVYLAHYAVNCAASLYPSLAHQHAESQLTAAALTVLITDYYNSSRTSQRAAQHSAPQV